MGRKLQAKNNSKKRNAGKETNKYVQQKRKELAGLIEKLLKLTSLFQVPTNTQKSWDHHLEIDSIIKEIINIENSLISKSTKSDRRENIEKFLNWLQEQCAKFDGIEISDFEEYELGLKAKKNFPEDSLLLTVPSKIMMSEQDAVKSELAPFIDMDPILRNMPNITLALFLLLEKNKEDSFWKPYIDILPEKYTTVLYFTLEELALLKPSPTFEASLKLCRSIARQYAYFYNKIYNMEDTPGLNDLREIFTYNNYRWAVSTVMTRQNHIRLADVATTAFIPLWDMCNHEQGKITTDFNKELNRGECYALRDYKAGDQIFIFYGARCNADLFLHNGFIYPNNQHDSLSLILGVSSGDPAREARLSLLNKLGLSGVTHFSLYKGEQPISSELLAFIRIFTMEKEELTKWSGQGIPSDLVSSEPPSVEAVGADLQRRAYHYLITRCKLIWAAYKMDPEESPPDSVHRKTIKRLKECELQILNGAIKYLENVLKNTANKLD